MDGNKYEYAPVLKAPSNGQDWVRWTSLENERKSILKSASDAISSKSVSGIESLEKWKEMDQTAKINQIADPNGPWKDNGLHAKSLKLNKDIGDLQKTFTTTLVAQDLAKPRETKVLERGEYNMPIGDPLEPGVPSVMGSLPDGAPKNRLGLAQWLTSRAVSYTHLTLPTIYSV